MFDRVHCKLCSLVIAVTCIPVSSTFAQPGGTWGHQGQLGQGCVVDLETIRHAAFDVLARFDAYHELYTLYEPHINQVLFQMDAAVAEQLCPYQDYDCFFERADDLERRDFLELSDELELMMDNLVASLPADGVKQIEDFFALLDCDVASVRKSFVRKSPTLKRWVQQDKDPCEEMDNPAHEPKVQCIYMSACIGRKYARRTRLLARDSAWAANLSSDLVKAENTAGQLLGPKDLSVEAAKPATLEYVFDAFSPLVSQTTRLVDNHIKVQTLSRELEDLRREFEDECLPILKKYLQ